MELDRLAAIESFNPNALSTQRGRLSVELHQSELTYLEQPDGGVSRQEIMKLHEVFFSRPKGDIYGHLCGEILRLKALRAPLTAEQGQNFDEFVGAIICAAMWDLAMCSESRAIVRKVYANFVPLGEVYWRTLVLYRAVVRYSEEIGAKLPADLTADLTWGRSMLRWAGTESQHRSKTSYRVLLAQYANALKNRTNPYNDSEPEDKAFVAYALKFSHWDDSIRDFYSKLPPSERRRRGNLRKDICNAIKGLSVSMFSLARFYKENTSIVALAINKRGQYCMVSDRNRLIPIDSEETNQTNCS